MGPDAAKAIGVFDSGVGGLTVYRRLEELLPDESIIYLGDTARVPYGTKSAETVIRYARACARVLVDQGIKLLVVACNTASAFALNALHEDLDIPVLGVVEPGAQCAARVTRTGRIGVIGTPGTIRSGAYQTAIHALLPSARVFVRGCPLFVPLAEEGWTEGPVAVQVAQTYLSDLCENGIDTLVLGCTHYPLLRDVIAETVGPSVTLVDSAASASAVAVELLDALEARRSGDSAPVHRFLVTDSPECFAEVGRRFLGRDMGTVEWVDF